MSEAESSVYDVMPVWMTQEHHRIVNEVVLLKNDTLAVTHEGLLTYPQVFRDGIDGFKHFNAEAYTNGRSIAGAVTVPSELPNLVLKREVENGMAVPTLLTLSAIQEAIPHETEDYVFHKLGLYWAFDLPRIGMIAMERVNTLEAASKNKHLEYLKAHKRFIHETKQSGYHVKPLPYQDLLYLGVSETGKPIITLVDEVDENILLRLDTNNQ